MSKKNILIIAIVILVIIVGVTFAFVNSKNQESEPEGETITDQDEWQMHKSNQWGYQIQYPQDWTIDDTRSNFPVDAIISPTEEAFVFINIFQDPRAVEPGGMDIILEDIKQIYESDHTHEVEVFERQQIGETDGYAASGSFFDVNGGEWKFKELGIYLQDGIGINVRANVKKEVASLYEDIINKIINSFESLSE